MIVHHMINDLENERVCWQDTISEIPQLFHQVLDIISTAHLHTTLVQ